ncbi:hypothetical protein ACWGJ2_00800 [Streptomyces sp. NPDC054796]
MIRDPYAHRLYWLVMPGTADAWVAAVPDTSFVQVLGKGCWLTVPPRDRSRGAGPYWQVPLTDGHALTAVDLLHGALELVLAQAPGPKRKPVS